MKLVPKQITLTLLVARSAYKGTPAAVVLEKNRGAWATGSVVDSPYRTLVPAKSAWLPAESTDVRITLFMKDAAASEDMYQNMFHC